MAAWLLFFSFFFYIVSEALAQTSHPHIKSEKHFTPGLEHNKYKVEAVTLTLTWKLSQAEVSGERKNILFLLWSGRVAEHICFNLFILFQLAR